ncbi:Mini-ribonuclease 3 [Vagococcus acidifermentans]|uniref:Mini-ribonuclease 3 n=1 Tax=Vagococcus acidifermentans TaxID=564710 RepID=A0A430ANM0_9ENTE|nr:Mini-ribonuclease 3 [Vagococcus acidifermentans]RSU09770.1 Mini-ribonuclease 3 [Vagococcus acidifermentans]
MTAGKDFRQLNGLTLAYIGDAVYEVFVRDYLIRSGQTRPNVLHKKATSYVSAKAQHYLMQELLANDWLTEEEAAMYRRGRNAKSHTIAKNADVATYRSSTGFEALVGYLHLTDQEERLSELMQWCITQIGEKQHDERIT